MTHTAPGWRVTLAAVVALLLAAFWLRLHDLDGTPPGFNYDAMYNVAQAYQMSQGAPLPPLLFDDRPEPLHRYLLAGWFRLMPTTRFSALYAHALLGLLTVALAYRAGQLGFGRLAGLAAAGAVAVSMPHVFLSRSAYRAALLSPFLLIAVIGFLWALKRQRASGYAWSGAAVGAALNSYLAGLVAPIWLVGLLVHSRSLARRGERAPWHGVGLALLAFLPFALVWLWLMTNIADPFFRLGGAEAATPGTDNGDLPLPQALLESASAYVDAAFHWMTFYNEPSSPFLELGFALLAGVGLIALAWRWRTAAGAMILGGLIGFSLPGALSELPTHPVRLSGALPFLALLVGLGTATLADTLVRLRPRITTPLLVGLLLLTGGHLLAVDARYHALYASPDRYDPPEFWRNIPHNHSMPLVEAMAYLAQVDVPTYVPVNGLDHRFFPLLLQGERGYRVTTLGHHPLGALPSGQIVYPAHDYLFGPTPAHDQRQALLLPQEDLIVLLPSSAGPLLKPDPDTPGVRELVSDYGWTFATAADFPGGPAPALPQTGADAVYLGENLRLVTPRAVTMLYPGEPHDIVVDLAVTGTTGRGLYSFVQLLDDGGLLYAGAGSDAPILPFLYPATAWQAGDVVPLHHTVTLPPDLPDGAYHWTIGAWASPVGQDRLDARAADGVYLGDRIYWGAGHTPGQTVERIPDAQPLDVRLDDTLRLIGYRVTQDSENAATVTLYWQADEATGRDYTIFVHGQRDGAVIAQFDGKPHLPTWAWAPGELIATHHPLTFDAPLDAFYAGLYTFPGPVNAVVTQDGAQPPDRRALLGP